MKWLLSVSIPVLLLDGCQHENLIADEGARDCTLIADTCRTLVVPNSPIGGSALDTGTHYMRPCFNPMNSEEFVFIQPGSFLDEMMVYNMNDGEFNTIVTGFNLTSQPKWSVKGWIAFWTPDWNVWIVKSNGDSLTQITNENLDRYPEWSPDGECLFYKRTTEPTVQCGLLWSIETHSIVDTIRAYGEMNWNSEYNICNEGHSRIKVYSMRIDELLGEATFTGDGGESHLIDAQWFPDNENIVCTLWHNGIVVVNTTDFSQTRIKESCASRYYNDVSVSALGEVLVEKVSARAGVVDILEKHEIWLMDSNGCNERRILPVE
ncbi:MAG: hypothetical protein SH856_07085 [Flavobacteriales bacterium]|nr:hypothetical protein [Flavobacteriales bacterium]